MWERLKKWFQGSGTPAAPAQPAVPKGGFVAPRPDLAGQEPAWIGAADNPFGVRVLDVRPVTLGTLSTSKDPTMAANAVSYGGEDGSSFAAQAPRAARRVDVELRLRAPARLVDGAIFIPREMEDKWAVFVHGGTLLLVRSWRREVVLRAPIRVEGDELRIGPLEGAIAHDGESADYTRRAVDFILRTHGLDAPWPAPLMEAGDGTPRALAIQCMSMFGRNAHFAAFDEPASVLPVRPLRTLSRLHGAVLRGDLDGARRALDGGLPVDLRDRFGRAAVHYVREPGPLLDLLRERGADLDDASEDGTTLLMYAAQDRRPALVRRLLDLGAAAGAADNRGFSALHRAAEMGEVEIARALLARGADPDRAAVTGHSPRALAALRGEATVLALFPPKPGSA